MSTVHTIEQALFELAPKELAMDWDNVGLLLGHPDQEVQQALIALDVTEAVAEEAIASDCQLIISHHPIMNCKWMPLQSIRNDTPQGHLLMKLLQHNISVICMHTNLDLAAGGVNDVLAETLKLVDPGPLGDEDNLCRAGFLESDMALQDFVSHVCRALNGNGVRYVDAGKPVRRVAVGGGACVEYVSAALAAGCDTFVTSDIKYHDFLDAAGQGINLIDAGHFPTEDPICTKVVSYLKNQFPSLILVKSTSHREVIQYYMEH